MTLPTREAPVARAIRMNEFKNFWPRATYQKTLIMLDIRRLAIYLVIVSVNLRGAGGMLGLPPDLPLPCHAAVRLNPSLQGH